MMRTQNATIAAASRAPDAGAHKLNLREFSESWERAARHCPCDGCGQVGHCATKQVACRAFRHWTITGHPSTHLPRVPDRSVVSVFADADAPVPVGRPRKNAGVAA